MKRSQLAESDPMRASVPSDTISNSLVKKREKASNNKKKEEWITTLDLAFLTLFSLYMLIEECWKNNILVIGLTKDTAAHDFKNHVIPICIRNEVWATRDNKNIKLTQEQLDNIPNTDRMFLNQ
jgi:hypothetical protein